MLVTFSDLTVTSNPNNDGKFTVSDGSGPIQVEDETIEIFVNQGLKIGDKIASLTAGPHTPSLFSLNSVSGLVLKDWWRISFDQSDVSISRIPLTDSPKDRPGYDH